MAPPCGVNGNNKRPGSWTEKEDAALAALVTKMGRKNWQKLAQHIPGRCAKSCRLRWCNQLDPELKKDKFTEWEEAVILQGQIELGNKWASIAKLMPGRSDNAIKNHFNTTLKRKMRSRLHNKFLLHHRTSLHSLLSTGPPKEEDPATTADQRKKVRPAATPAAHQQLPPPNTTAPPPPGLPALLQTAAAALERLSGDPQAQASSVLPSTVPSSASPCSPISPPSPTSPETSSTTSSPALLHIGGELAPFGFAPGPHDVCPFTRPHPSEINLLTNTCPSAAPAFAYHPSSSSPSPSDLGSPLPPRTRLIARRHTAPTPTSHQLVATSPPLHSDLPLSHSYSFPPPSHHSPLQTPFRHPLCSPTQSTQSTARPLAPTAAPTPLSLPELLSSDSSRLPHSSTAASVPLSLPQQPLGFHSYHPQRSMQYHASSQQQQQQHFQAGAQQELMQELLPPLTRHPSPFCLPTPQLPPSSSAAITSMPPPPAHTFLSMSLLAPAPLPSHMLCSTALSAPYPVSAPPLAGPSATRPPPPTFSSNSLLHQSLQSSSLHHSLLPLSCDPTSLPLLPPTPVVFPYPATPITPKEEEHIDCLLHHHAPQYHQHAQQQQQQQPAVQRRSSLPLLQQQPTSSSFAPGSSLGRHPLSPFPTDTCGIQCLQAYTQAPSSSQGLPLSSPAPSQPVPLSRWEVTSWAAPKQQDATQLLPTASSSSSSNSSSGQYQQQQQQHFSQQGAGGGSTGGGVKRSVSAMTADAWLHSYTPASSAQVAVQRRTTHPGGSFAPPPPRSCYGQQQQQQQVVLDLSFSPAPPSSQAPGMGYQQQQQEHIPPPCCSEPLTSRHSAEMASLPPHAPPGTQQQQQGCHPGSQGFCAPSTYAAPQPGGDLQPLPTPFSSSAPYMPTSASSGSTAAAAGGVSLQTHGAGSSGPMLPPAAVCSVEPLLPLTAPTTSHAFPQAPHPFQPPPPCSDSLGANTYIITPAAVGSTLHPAHASITSYTSAPAFRPLTSTPPAPATHPFPPPTSTSLCTASFARPHLFPTSAPPSLPPFSGPAHRGRAPSSAPFPCPPPTRSCTPLSATLEQHPLLGFCGADVASGLDPLPHLPPMAVAGGLDPLQAQLCGGDMELDLLDWLPCSDLLMGL